MNFKKNTVTVNSRKNVCEKTNVHPVTASFVLPDYYPDVSRIMKTSANVTVLSWNTKGKNLSYELLVKMTVLYKSSESELIQSFSKMQNISGTAELEEECEDPVCIIKPDAESFSCRAKSERRIEFEGSATVILKVSKLKPCELLCDCFGGSIHAKKSSLNYIKDISLASKDFTVTEEIPINDVSISGASVLMAEISPEITEIKNVSGKTLIKGVLNASVLYTFAGENEDNICSISTPVSFSRVIDLKNPEDNNSALKIKIFPSDPTCKTVNDSKGFLKHFELSTDIKICCMTYTYGKTEYIEDIYSTKYQTDTSFSHFLSESPEKTFDKISTVKSHIECSSVKKIYNFSCHIKNIHAKCDSENKKILFEGTVSSQLLSRNIDGSVMITEKDLPFEITENYAELTENSFAECEAVVKHCSYNMTSDSRIETETEIKLCCRISERKAVKAVAELIIDEEKKLERKDNTAFRIYFAEAGESIWDIAKRYGTDHKAIMESNSLENGILEAKQPLLIPMTD